jgi:hypothetical protein
MAGDPLNQLRRVRAAAADHRDLQTHAPYRSPP